MTPLIIVFALLRGWCFWGQGGPDDAEPGWPGAGTLDGCWGGCTFEDPEVSGHGRGVGAGGAKEMKTEDGIWNCGGDARWIGQGDVSC